MFTIKEFIKTLKNLVLLVVSINVYADDAQIENIFKENNATGSILIESGDGKVTYQYNINAGEVFVPASTFKIPNTLIILEEGLIKNSTDIMGW